MTVIGSRAPRAFLWLVAGDRVGARGAAVQKLCPELIRHERGACRVRATALVKQLETAAQTTLKSAQNVSENNYIFKI